MYVMTPEILKFIPKDEYFGMDALMKDMLSAAIPISKYEVNEYWLDIGRMDDYQKAQDMYERQMAEAASIPLSADKVG
jgi:NDP-sugar pyrophosphorylase family protein